MNPYDFYGSDSPEESSEEDEIGGEGSAGNWYATRDVRTNRRGENPYVRWGDTRRLTFTTLQTTQLTEFQRVELPRPTVCMIQLHVEAAVTNTILNGVNFVAFTYAAGVGSTNASIRRVYPRMPQGSSATQPNGTPLDVQWIVTLSHLYARAEASGTNVVISFRLLIAPYALEQLA